MAAQYTVEGRACSTYAEARALAVTLSIQYARAVSIMEKLDRFTAAHVVETIHTEAR